MNENLNKLESRERRETGSLKVKITGTVILSNYNAGEGNHLGYNKSFLLYLINLSQLNLYYYSYYYYKYDSIKLVFKQMPKLN